MVTACDDLSRFSYENYKCEPRLTSLFEIRVGKFKRGSSVNISLATEQTRAKITSLRKKEFII